jgi:hypothetical protein
VEAKIEIGVAAAKAEEAMNARQPVTAFKLLLDLVKRYPGNVSALHKYYDFLLKHRIKLSDEERAAALEYARRLWPDARDSGRRVPQCLRRTRNQGTLRPRRGR